MRSRRGAAPRHRRHPGSPRGIRMPVEDPDLARSTRDKLLPLVHRDDWLLVLLVRLRLGPGVLALVWQASLFAVVRIRPRAWIYALIWQPLLTPIRFLERTLLTVAVPISFFLSHLIPARFGCL